MKKDFKGLSLFIIGMCSLSIGVIFTIKSNLGISVSSSLPYVLSLRFQNITLGTWNYIVQGIVFILLVVIMKKITVNYIMSFFISYLFGWAVDGANYIFAFLEASTLLGTR